MRRKLDKKITKVEKSPKYISCSYLVLTASGGLVLSGGLRNFCRLRR